MPGTTHINPIRPTTLRSYAESILANPQSREGRLLSKVAEVETRLPAGPSWSRVIEAAVAPLAPRGATRTRAPAPSPARRSDVAVIRRAMADAASVRRSPGPEGTEKLLNKRELKRLDHFFKEASPKVVAAVARIIKSVDTEDASVARGLILRAVCARHPIKGPRAKSMRDVRAFARKLQSFTGAEMLERATVLDLNSRVNTSNLDPTKLWGRRGVIRVDATSDTAGDNDGLFQRFTGTCGPTTLQMMLCEADPIYAFAVNEAGRNSDSIIDSTSEFQSTLLEAYGGISLSVTDAQFRSRIRNALGRLRLSGKVSARDAKALRKVVANEGDLTRNAKRAVEAIRENYEGFPTKADLRRFIVTGPHPKKDEGMDNDGFTLVLNGSIGARTGITYASTKPDWGFARGQAYRHMDAVASALRKGIDVPFGIDEPAHYMLLTNVKGYGSNRSFLVSDPYCGRTAWVKEKDFLSGSFVNDVFHLCSPGERGYVDSFFLPTDTWGA